MTDFKTLMESAGDDAACAGELLIMFEKQMHREMDRLTVAIGHGEAGQAASLAHKLVGSAAACGFEDLSRALRALELDCLKAIPADIELQMGNLSRLFKEGGQEMSILLAYGGNDEKSTDN